MYSVALKLEQSALSWFWSRIKMLIKVIVLQHLDHPITTGFEALWSMGGQCWSIISNCAELPWSILICAELHVARSKWTKPGMLRLSGGKLGKTSTSNAAQTEKCICKFAMHRISFILSCQTIVSFSQKFFFVEDSVDESGSRTKSALAINPC